jgi:hypothetical protein
MQLRFGHFHKACDKECLAERDGADEGNSERNGKSPGDGERGMKVFDFEAAVSQEEAQSSSAEELLALETHDCATTSTAGGASLSNSFSPSNPFKTPFTVPVEISLESPSTLFKAIFSKDLEIWSSTSVASASHSSAVPIFFSVAVLSS